MVAKGLGLDKEPEYPFILSGGNFTHEGSLLAELTTKEAAISLPNSKVAYPTVDIAGAGALLAINKFNLDK